MRAEPGHQAERADLELPAQRLVLLSQPVDLGDHPLGRLGVEAADRVLVDRGEVLRSEIASLGGAHRGDLDHVAVDADADRVEEGAGERASRHPGGGLAGAGPLEHVPDVAVAELERPGEVRVPGTRQVRFLDLGLDRPRVHPLLPVRVVAVCDQDRDRAAEGAPVAHPGADLDRVALDLHPPAAAMAELAPRHVAIERRPLQPEPGWHALDDRNQARPVRLARCCECQSHAPSVKRVGARGLRRRSRGATRCEPVPGCPFQSMTKFATRFANVPRARKGAKGIVRERAAQPWRAIRARPRSDPETKATSSAITTAAAEVQAEHRPQLHVTQSHRAGTDQRRGEEEAAGAERREAPLGERAGVEGRGQGDDDHGRHRQRPVRDETRAQVGDGDREQQGEQGDVGERGGHIVESRVSADLFPQPSLDTC